MTDHKGHTDSGDESTKHDNDKTRQPSGHDVTPEKGAAGSAAATGTTARDKHDAAPPQPSRSQQPDNAGNNGGNKPRGEPDDAARDKSAARTGRKPAADKQAAPRGKTRQSSTTGQSGGTGHAASRKTTGGSDRKPGRLAAVVAVLALLVALVALAASAWLWYQSRQQDNRYQAHLEASQSEMRSDILGQLKPRLSVVSGKVSDLQDAQDKDHKAMSDVQDRLQDTQVKVADLDRLLRGGARHWQLRQIEQLLVTANRRLQLYRQPTQARLALQLASKSIARLNDPRLFKVRKKVIDDIAALDAVPTVDVEGMALTLSSFVGEIGQLPLQSDVNTVFTKDAAENGGIEFTSGWHRFVDSIADTLKQLVTVRRSDATQPALLPPDQAWFLRQNLMLALRSARLALLEGQNTLYANSLDTAIHWLEQYYVTHDTAVQNMIKRLNQMQNARLDWQAPDIGDSLAALREYMHQRSRNGQMDEPQQDQP